MKIKERLERYSFEIEDTGGNCQAYVKYYKYNYSIMVTCEFGHSLPEEYPILVGLLQNDRECETELVYTEFDLMEVLIDYTERIGLE